MGWKEYGEKVALELKAANETIAILRHELAGSEEQLNTNTNGEHQRKDTPGVHPQATELLRQLEDAKAAKDEYAKEAALADEQVQNTLSKLSKMEKDMEEKMAGLQAQLAGKNEQLRRAQASRASDQATSKRESQLNERVATLKAGIASQRDENAHLKSMNERLSRQLQVEKKENASRHAFMQSDPAKAHDEDDEEPLPGALPVRTKPKTPPPASFRMPPTIPPQYLKPGKHSKTTNFDGTPIAPSGPLGSKKRKRSKQEELDEEIRELGEISLKEIRGSREKKRVSYRDDSNDEMEDAGCGPAVSNNKRQDSNASVGSGSDDNFDFKAVTKYKANGDIDSYYRSSDLEACEDLLRRIEMLRSGSWERSAGYEWNWEFTKTGYNPKVPHCVTQKLEKKHTKWRVGGEAKFACKDCASQGRPCFAFIGEKDGVSADWRWFEFRLLPLHEQDRIKQVAVGKTEIRYWVNDDIEMVEPDGASSDDEYVE